MWPSSIAVSRPSLRKQRMLITLDDVRRGRRDSPTAPRARVDGRALERVDHGVYLIAGAPLRLEDAATGGRACRGTPAPPRPTLPPARLMGLPGFSRAGSRCQHSHGVGAIAGVRCPDA